MAVLADDYFPFNGSLSYEDRWRLMAPHWLRSGPINGKLNEVEVYADSSGLQVKVKTGHIVLDGHTGIFSTEKTLAIAAYVSSRFDLVVGRVTHTSGTRTIEIDVLTGAGGVSIPTLTQNSSIWEEALALVLIDSGAAVAAGKVTDWRTFAASTGGVTVCATAAIRPGTLGTIAAMDGETIYEADTNRWRGREGSVWRWVGGKIVGWQGNRGTGLTVVSGNWTRPALNDVYDVDAIHAGTDSFITIAETGTYRVTGIVNFGAQATGGRGVGVNIGSAAHTGTGAPTDVLSLIPAPSTNGTFVNGCDEFDLTAGQIVTFVVMSNGTGVGLDVLSAKFTCTLIGYRT